jgi:hypothetical protein
MYDYNTVKLLHRHSDEDWVPMTEGSRHDVAGHDPERGWLHGAKLFRCTRCDEEIAMMPPTESGSAAPGETG